MSCYGPSRVQVRRKLRYGILGRSSYEVTVPCGNCLGCRAEQARQWGVRMLHESRMHEVTSIVSLTYKEVPKNGSLDSGDFQSFIKDLRRDRPPRSVSYFGCGEYGGGTKRPHYHAVLFGPDFLDRYSCVDDRGRRFWRSPSLEAHWGRGIAEVDEMSKAGAMYVAGYVRKKLGPKADDFYERVDKDTGELVQVEPEFSRMSLKPALGRRWLEKYWTDVYPRDFVVIDGTEQKPPRYYDKWMDQRHGPESSCWLLLGGCEKHIDIMEEVRQRRYDEAIELTDYQLHAKKRKHEARNSLYGIRSAI